MAPKKKSATADGSNQPPINTGVYGEDAGSDADRDSDLDSDDGSDDGTDADVEAEDTEAAARKKGTDKGKGKSSKKSGRQKVQGMMGTRVSATAGGWRETLTRSLLPHFRGLNT